MNTNFLQNTGDILHFVDRNEFEALISFLDISVPKRHEGRKSYHRERFSIIRFLKALAASSQIDFPLLIRKSESPDFVLTLADHRTIGIEHRDIATERYQRFLSKTSKFRNTEECLDDDNYLKALKEADLPSVTYGDADDYEWANLALSAISDKIDLLNRGHFESLDSFELILYSNTHLQNILNKYRAIASLANKLNKELIGRFHSRLYDSISIIYGDEVWLRDLKLLKQARIGKEGNKEIDLGFETPRQCYLPSNQHQALNELRGILSDEFAVQALVLYGSVARGEADEESDLDLLVVTDQPLTRVARHQKITDMVFEINLRYSTNISTLVVDRNSWEVGVVSVLPLKDEILKDGICL